MTWSARSTMIAVSLLLLAMIFPLAVPLWENLSAAFGFKPRVLTLENIPFNGRQAYSYLEEICALGPRISGSEGMQKQQALLTEHFEKLGAKVTRQEWNVRHPNTGNAVMLTNLIVSWHPAQKERVLLCAHYDTRPFPDEDSNPKNQRLPFLGANDGASGVALLMELGRDMKEIQPKEFGVDFIFFDAEEFIYVKKQDPFFLGSEHFAREYIASPPEHVYRAGVLLDMVGDKELQLYYERNSMYNRDVKPITVAIWKKAEKLGVSEFIPRTRHDLSDDHLALINIAKIPTCDIIDFDYPQPGRDSFWHTVQDKPENCSALSLAKVGWVVREWLREYKVK